MRLLAEHGFEANALNRKFQTLTSLDGFQEIEEAVPFDDLPNFMEYQVGFATFLPQDEGGM